MPRASAPRAERLRAGSILSLKTAFLALVWMATAFGLAMPAIAAAAPVISAITPAKGPRDGGNQVVITGSGFTGTTGVTFDSKPATFTANSDTQITATVPAGNVTGYVAVVVGTASGWDTGSYRYMGGAQVNTRTPQSGPAGTVITLTGQDMAGTTSVEIGGVSVPFTVTGDTQIVFTAPGGTGAADITITTPSGVATISGAFFYLTAPTVTSIAPDTGSGAGGTMVQISGTQLNNVTSVKFGSVNATNFTVSGGTIFAVAPPGSGVQHVTVTNPQGTSATSSADQFTYITGPRISGITPDRGPSAGGTSVVIEGYNLGQATAVKFGSTNATSFTVEHAGRITAVAPAGLGVVDVSVITPQGTSTVHPDYPLSARFTYENVPVATALSPSSGPTGGGTTVTITGSNFTGATAVYFGSNTATFTVNSATQITATAPAGNAGPAWIFVVNANGESPSNPNVVFTYGTVPVVTAITPATGPTAGGTSMNLTGSGFTGATSVMFGSTPAQAFVVVSDTILGVLTPAGVVGPVHVTVTANGGVSATTAADVFTYGTMAGITGMSPRRGPIAGGQTITINGSAFTGATSVTFGGVPAASFTVQNDGRIVAVSPAKTAGPADVVITTPGGVSPITGTGRYTYVNPPVVISLEPSTGSTGIIRIWGTDLDTPTAVLFGSTPATVVTSGANQIAVQLPTGLEGQTVDVAVTTAGGTSTTSAATKFTFDGVTTPPVVTSLSRAAGEPNQGLDIVGRNLASVTSVKFGTLTASFNVRSATLMSVVVPAGVIGETVDVTVTGPGGTSAVHAGTRFTFAGLPIVTSVSPASGPAAGGTSFTINGSGFSDNSVVKVGYGTATNVVVVSRTQITATTPPGVGDMYVLVTTPGGTSDWNVNTVFSYVGGSYLSAISPTTGPVSGGTSVQLQGISFKASSTVQFGGVPAASVTFVSATELVAVSPAGSGVVDVTVTTDGYTTPNNGIVFTYVGSRPVVTSISPEFTGSPENRTPVTIIGEHFTGASGVLFGAVWAPTFVIQSDGQILAQAPAGALGQTVDVRVAGPGGTSNIVAAARFTYGHKPFLNSVTPSQGLTAGGTSVRLGGGYFIGATSVKFGSVEASSFTVTDNGWITAIAPPGAAGTVDVTVTSPAGTSDVIAMGQFTYLGPLTFETPSPLTPATVGLAYSRTITATGGGSQNIFTLTAGSLPPGLTLQDALSLVSVKLAGTPTQAGTFNFTLRTVNSIGQAGEQAYSLTVAAPTIAITPATLPAPTIIVPYSQAITATGGIAPHVFSVKAGALPAGLSLDGATGVISGTPTTMAAFAFTVTATDSSTGTGPYTGSQAYSGSVVANPPTVAATAAAAAYNTASVIDLSGSISGSPATSLAVVSPASHGATTVNGLAVTYTPTTGYIGQDSFTYAATGPGGTSAPATVTVTVAGAMLSLSPSSLPDAAQAVAYSQALGASGGAAPYSFSIASGALPAGLTLSTGGVISGTPTQSGTFDVTLRVSDSSTGTGPAVATRAYSLVVGAPPPPTAEPQAVTVAISPGAGGTANIDLSSAVTYASGIQIVRQPEHGTLTVSGFVVTYTPTPGYYGEDSFDFVAIPLANNPRARSALAAAGATVTITIAPPVLTLGPATLPGVNVGTAYSQPLTAAGGTAPYSFTVTAGALPAGLTLSTNGVLSGAPTTAGTYGFTVRATDASTGAGPFSISTAYSLVVGAVPTTAPPIRVTTVQGAEVSVDLTAAAAGGPFTAAAVSALSPSTAGEARIVEAGSGSARRFSLTFKSTATFSGDVEATYTLSNADGVSAPGTVIITVEARPDPSQDPDVRGVITAQTDAAVRLAETQISNFGQRLEALHGGGTGRFNNGVTLGFGFEDAALNDPWTQQQQDRERLSGFWPTLTDASGGRAGAVPGGFLSQREGSASQDIGAEGQISVWTGGSIQFGRRDARSGTSKFEFTSGGLSLGADLRLNDRFVFGVGGGYGQTTTEVGDNDTKVEARDYFGVAYASFNPVDGAFIDGLLGYGRLDFDSRRTVPIGPLAPAGAVAQGSRGGDQLILSLTGGWDWQGDVLKLSPYARVSSITGTLDGFTESGAGLANLRFEAQDIGSFKVALGARGERSFKTSHGVFTPRARFEYQRELKDADGATLGYADWGDGPVFSVTPNPFGRETLLLGLGGELRRQRSMFSLDYQGTFGEAGDYVSELVGRISLEF